MQPAKSMLPAVIAALTISVTTAFSDPVPLSTWGVIGEATSVARAGNTVYATGGFYYVGPNAGGGVPLHLDTGAPLAAHPRVAGVVRVAISDGEGGWFIGGDFTAVEGETRPNLAHLLASGEVADWRVDVREHTEGIRPADPNPIGSVAALALHGSTLYIGGRFPGVGQDSPGYLIAVNSHSGEIKSFVAGSDGPVSALAVHSGRLFVGGKFTNIGGAPRTCLAALDLQSGQATDWNPSADGAVLTFAFRGRTVFVGGEFDHAGGAPRNSIAALDVVSGAATNWDAKALPLRRYIAHGNWVWPFVADLELRGSTLYVGGYFASFQGIQRPLIAALDVATGRPTSFDARVGGGYVKALALSGNSLYLGGYLADVSGNYRPNAAAVDATTGEVREWNPRVYGVVQTLESNGSTVFAGGMISLIGDWRAQRGSVAFDATTGALLPWNPQFGGRQVFDLLGTETTLYAAGNFLEVDGNLRGMMAAFDAATGELLPWDPWHSQATGSPGPGRSYEVRRLARIGDTIYAGGFFDQIHGVPRGSLAAFDGVTGALLDWSPNLRRWDRRVWGMAAQGGDLFVTGTFDSAGLQARRDFVKLDGVTGLALPFDTQPGFPMWYRLGSDPSYRAIAPMPDRVFAGGWIYDEQARRPYGVRLFSADGARLPWDARFQQDPQWVVGEKPAVEGLVALDHALILGGRFDVAGGAQRRNLAALDTETGEALDWNPDAGYWPTYSDSWGVNDIDRFESTLYVAGGFVRLGGYPCSGIGAVALPRPPGRLRAEASPLKRTRETLGLLPIAPVTAGAVATIELSLATRSLTTFEVFDLQGRRISTPFRDEVREPGTHPVLVETRGWSPGLYYCRLSTGAAFATARLLVLR